MVVIQEEPGPDSAPGVSDRASSTSVSHAQTASSTRPRPSAASAASSAAGTSPETSPSNAGAGHGSSVPGGGVDYGTFQFLSSTFILAMAVVCVFPFTPGALGMRCYYTCLMGYFLLSFSDVFQHYGLPRSFSLGAAQTWLRDASSGPELYAILYSGAFLPQPLVLAVIPVACHLALPVAEFLQQRVGSAWIYRAVLEKPCVWLTANKSTVKLYAANFEIFLGFVLLALLFSPQGSLITLLYYWQVLRAEFHSAATAEYHRHAWTGYGANVEPVLQQYAPALLTVVSYGKEWFKD